MDQTVKRLLDGQEGNHLLPFFWLHGESEEKLREYVGAIQAANCGAFCVESRPHPDFAGEGWWRDMDVILDEAEKRGMKVWILDDSHFPTGYANGALRDADPSLCRQSIFCRRLRYTGKARTVDLPLEKLAKPPRPPMSPFQRLVTAGLGKQRQYDDDQVYSVAAYGPDGQVYDLTGEARWEKPEGDWEVAVCGLSRNCGPHRNYINMMDPASCRKLIDAVYEPHYAHYGDRFGTVIAGFFSDEPELGNGVIYAKDNQLGTEQDLPWSAPLAAALEERYGERLYRLLPLLWKNDRMGAAFQFETERFRVAYMDLVSRLVSQAFSQQLGNWCRERGVQYIGHLIEDDDTHTRTGSGLGHYFRGIAGQDMAGVDDIGGQVLPQGEDEPKKTFFGPRNGGFYHYTLAKLGVSSALLDPRKRGRCLCEIFGAYGWGTGVSEMKYLADHFLVRGVNYFVPHAFSPKAYPDSDCPPHFYASGNNPQYQAIGDLFRYMNRVSELISGGELVHRVAILYNAEADWAGAREGMDRVARLLYDHQIDYAFLPLDWADQAGRYDAILLPRSDYWPEAVLSLPNALFVDALPENLLGADAQVVAKEDLIRRLEGLRDAIPTPAYPWLRCLRYRQETDRYLFVNEGAEPWTGTVTVPVSGPCYAYDAWENTLRAVDAQPQGDRTALSFTLEPRHSLIVLFDQPDRPLKAEPPAPAERRELTSFFREVCRAAQYPQFGGGVPVTLPRPLSQDLPRFSGFARYTTEFRWERERCELVITGECQAVEVFVNGVSAGRRIVPTYRFDLSDLVRRGKNQLVIQVATTLERENGGPLNRLTGGRPAPTGLTGQVFLEG